MKRYLAIPGCLVLVAALIRATVNARWDPPNIWLAAVGAVILAITVAVNWQEVVDWLRDPRGIFAVTTGISVAVFVGVLVMVNIATSNPNAGSTMVEDTVVVRPVTTNAAELWF